MIRATLVIALVLVGVFFLTVGTIGLLRLPNVYNRMHATSKPTTLGTAAIFLAAFVQFGPGGEGLTALVGAVFLFLTVPTGAHMIARAAERIGVPFLGSVTWPDASQLAREEEPRADAERGAERDAERQPGTGPGPDPAADED
ncbi:multicomponent Na+:H+ antiporter subunit G [Halobiforma haloterrestris]|uniref:Multicomponent Na+:H+ antiporter subunit G n=1 Tax=Natronobacterium haloterrestre TaxID=148448 RepID=A0A1I1K6H8_NATHA|nr:monovalent cation/H(+) antiporter subunit G [Halobiforma haloterrestris]SFC55862.1 multicomponent Na+:H+ antiporter subunit G [Halobiforma haloterrestris]